MKTTVASLRFLSAAAGMGMCIAALGAFGQTLSTRADSAPGSAQARAYPTRPIRLIAPSAPGSTADTLARMVAQKLTDSWRQQVVVDNRPGAAGIIATGIAAKAPADGYTILMVAGNHAINSSLYSKLPYDAVKDFAPVTQVGAAPLLVVAHPSLPVASIREVIALAKSRPGGISYASGGKGTPSHLTMELFKSMAGVDLLHVPYTGGGPVLNAILSGETQLTASGVLILMSHVKTGKVRALAVTGPRRSPAAPDVPTVAESGLPGFSVSGWWGILAPGPTPKAIVTRLSRELARLVQMPELRDRLAAAGIEPLGSSPEEFSEHIRQEIARWAKVVKDSGARVD